MRKSGVKIEKSSYSNVLHVASTDILSGLGAAQSDWNHCRTYVALPRFIYIRDRRGGEGVGGLARIGGRGKRDLWWRTPIRGH